jgi:ferrous iron transport protein B
LNLLYFEICFQDPHLSRGRNRGGMASQEERLTRKVILVGNPNVGKSVIFRLLTGSYVMVSNFTCTTVEVSRGRVSVGGNSYEIVDTPGVHSLVPQSEDERVTCEALLEEKPDLVVQVADAKNLRRTLLIASQLVEFRIPMVLVLNMMDEAQERGVEIDTPGLSRLLSIPVVETVAIFSQGRRQLMQAMQNASVPVNPLREFHPISHISSVLSGSGNIPGSLATEWLALGDAGFSKRLESALGAAAVEQLEQARRSYSESAHRSLAKDVAESRQEFLEQVVDVYKKKRQAQLLARDDSRASRIWLALLIAGLVFFAWNEFGGLAGLGTPYRAATRYLAERLAPGPGGASWISTLLFARGASGRGQFGLALEALHFMFFIAPVVLPFGMLISRSRKFALEVGILTRRALTGIPILICVLLLLFEFVGYTGAQTMVGFLEEILFGRFVIPLIRGILPAGIFEEFLTGKFGLISMGVTYAIAIVLPVVTTFFIAFSLLEDSGYLPRLSILSDRVMRLMGLNGKATLPMVLGLGCCTMATITTRVLSSRKERLLATLLLALGIPCSAQLGVILGIASGFSPAATMTVIGVVVMQLFLVGFLASKLIRGPRSEFIFEIPPIRVPQIKNIALKTGYRIKWYLKEALPLFLYGTGALFILDKVHLAGLSMLEWLQRGLAPVMTGLLHLPEQAASVFVLGFLRRDYGAAGLFQMARAGMLNAQQVVVSLVVITLFVPCLASFLVIAKEQGMKRAVAITSFIVPFAIAVGTVLSWVLRILNITYG